ncbi:MAG: methyltransferase domain-containing protein [Acidimicrobiia bacterium]
MSDQPNAEQTAAWDGHEGDAWTDHADGYDRVNGRARQHLLDAQLVGPDDHVLDVGCGTGGLSRALARVAANGAVTGIDLSTRMLALAEQRAADEGIGNAAFVRGDAQIHPFEPDSFDAVISSFGVMFFDDPVAAFTNIGRALRTGGAFAAVTWRAPHENEWLTLLRGALALGRDLPSPPSDMPGPFAFGDADRVRDLLGRAGFAGIDLTPIDEPIDLGATASDAFAFASAMGIVEGLTDGLAADEREVAMANLASLIEEHETAEGVLVDAAFWLITARNA